MPVSTNGLILSQATSNFTILTGMIDKHWRAAWFFSGIIFCIMRN